MNESAVSSVRTGARCQHSGQNMHVRGKKYHGFDISIVVSTITLQLHKLNLEAGSGYTDYEGSAGRGKKHHYLGTP